MVLLCLVLSSVALMFAAVAVHVALTANENARRAMLIRWHPALRTPPPEDSPEWPGR
jgi:hypothetical protein